MPNRLASTSPFFTELDNNKDWIAEVKKNGWRCLIYRGVGNEIHLMTRHKTLVKEPMVELKQFMLHNLPENTILDGELIHYRTKNDKQRYYLFDVIMSDGQLVNNLSLFERRPLLEKLIGRELPNCLELSRWVRLGKKNLYEQSITNDLNEGVVLKKLNSVYPLSDKKCLDNPFWIKVKKDERKENKCDI